MLLGLIDEGDGVAALSLESLGSRSRLCGSKFRESSGLVAACRATPHPSRHEPRKFSSWPCVRRCNWGYRYIGSEHILLGLVGEGEGVAATVLIDLGADLGSVRQKVMQFMSGHPDAESTRTAGELSFWGRGITGDGPPVPTLSVRPW